MVGLKVGLGWVWRTEKVLPPWESRTLQPVASRYKLPFMVSNTRTISDYIVLNNIGGTGRGLI